MYIFKNADIEFVFWGSCWIRIPVIRCLVSVTTLLQLSGLARMSLQHTYNCTFFFIFAKTKKEGISHVSHTHKNVIKGNEVCLIWDHIYTNSKKMYGLEGGIAIDNGSGVRKKHK